MKSSLHSLINFLPFLLIHLRLPSPELDPFLDNNSLKRQSQSYIATDGQSVSKSWCRAPSGAHYQIFITVTVLFLWGALPNERTSLSFLYAAGPCQRSLSRVRVPWDSRPYFMSQIWDFPFRRLLRLAESRWRYSTLPPHGISLGCLTNCRPVIFDSRTV
jgi:hypothetical protein